MLELAARFVSLCLALAGVETLHGIARLKWLVPRLGRRRAQQVGIVTGSLLALAVCWLAVPGFGLAGGRQLLALGLALAVFMAGFDVLIARVVARRPWAAVRADFDPRSGNYLLLGLLFLVVAPLLVMALAGVRR